MTKPFSYNVKNPEDPDGELVEMVFQGSLIEFWYKYQRVKYQNLITAKYVLDEVQCIYRGVRRHQEGGWCFLGRPKEWCIKPDIYATFPDNLIYAVYLNPRMHLYEHRAESVDPNDSTRPIDWETRYEGLVWKNTS